MCGSMFMHIYAVYWLRPASSAFSSARTCNRLAASHNGNEMRNAICADTSIELFLLYLEIRCPCFQKNKKKRHMITLKEQREFLV